MKANMLAGCSISNLLICLQGSDKGFGVSDALDVSFV